MNLNIKNNRLNIGFWSLLLTNLYLIYYYSQHPNSFGEIVVLYWVQSCLIGVFTVLDMLTLKTTTLNQNNIKTSEGKGCGILFFIIHYGFFHFGYMIFIAVKVVDFKTINWSFLKIAILVLIASAVINYIQHLILSKNATVKFTSLFILPYLRIIPIHLLILIPAFFNIKGVMLFLVLKTVTDLATYMLYQNIVFKPNPET